MPQLVHLHAAACCWQVSDPCEDPSTTGVALSLLSSQLPAVRRTGCKPCRPDVPFLMDDCLQAYLALMTALYQYSLMDCSIMQSSACRCMSLSSRSSGYQFCARMCQPGLGRGGVAGADSSTPSAGEIV